MICLIFYHYSSRLPCLSSILPHSSHQSSFSFWNSMPQPHHKYNFSDMTTGNTARSWSWRRNLADTWHNPLPNPYSGPYTLNTSHHLNSSISWDILPQPALNTSQPENCTRSQSDNQRSSSRYPWMANNSWCICLSGDLCTDKPVDRHPLSFSRNRWQPPIGR